MIVKPNWGKQATLGKMMYEGMSVLISVSEPINKSHNIFVISETMGDYYRAKYGIDSILIPHSFNDELPWKIKNRKDGRKIVQIDGIFSTDLNIQKLEIFFDRNLNFVKEFKLRGVPTTVLINKKGEEFARIIGSIDFQDKKFLEWLSNYD